jgi:hypothetical protein
MQTNVWMAYSCSLCFSDRFSYIKHFISSYGSEDMNFARFEQFMQKKTKQEGASRAGPALSRARSGLLVATVSFGPRG